MSDLLDSSALRVDSHQEDRPVFSLHEYYNSKGRPNLCLPNSTSLFVRGHF